MTNEDIKQKLVELAKLSLDAHSALGSDGRQFKGCVADMELLLTEITEEVLQ